MGKHGISIQLTRGFDSCVLKIYTRDYEEMELGISSSQIFSGQLRLNQRDAQVPLAPGEG